MRTSLFSLALARTHNSQESSRSRIKSQSPDASFTHNNQKSSRSQIKSQSPDASSSSNFLEDLGRADIFGPLSGEQDPHDRPIATVGISLGNTHVFVMGYQHGISKQFISAMLTLEKQYAKYPTCTCHTPTHKHIHGVCAYTFTGVGVCVCV